MNDHEDFKSLFCAHADPVPDEGFTERLIGRIRYRAQRRRAILAATMTLAIAAAAAAAWMVPTRALAWDVQSTIAVLLLLAASGLIAVGTETSPPARRASLGRY